MGPVNVFSFIQLSNFRDGDIDPFCGRIAAVHGEHLPKLILQGKNICSSVTPLYYRKKVKSSLKRTYVLVKYGNKIFYPIPMRTDPCYNNNQSIFCNRKF